jgi:hypothetical protein
MRVAFFLFAFLLMILFSSAQETLFPESFIGKWKGTLTWNRPAKAPQQFTMQLNIQSTDSGRYTWQIIYGDDQKDNRPYLLVPVDTAKGHWQIDERNTIVLDGYFLGNSFTSVFSVSGNTILSKYELTAEGLLVSFITVTTKPIASTGGTSKEIPPVDSYQLKSEQKGLLKRDW